MKEVILGLKKNLLSISTLDKKGCRVDFIDGQVLMWTKGKILEEKSSPQKVSLGDDYQYPIKGIVESSYKLDSGTSMKMKEVLYV